MPKFFLTHSLLVNSLEGDTILHHVLVNHIMDAALGEKSCGLNLWESREMAQQETADSGVAIQ